MRGDMSAVIMSKGEVFVRSKSVLVRVMGTFDAFALNVINISYFPLGAKR